jgi:type IV secretion system protein VirB4
MLDGLLGGKELRSGPSLRQGLGLWWGSGERAWALSGARDELDLAAHSVVGIDLTHVLADPITSGPVLDYIFYRVGGVIGTPMILDLDEAWFASRDSLFAPQLLDWAKTGRKRNLVLGFASQSPQDFLSNELLAPTLIDNCSTQFWFPNPKADPESCRRFGLSGKEIEIVRTLPDTSRCFLLKQGAASVVARLDLSGRPDLLSVLSARAESLARMDRIRERVGNDPSQWLPIFLGRQPEV